MTPETNVSFVIGWISYPASSFTHTHTRFFHLQTYSLSHFRISHITHTCSPIISPPLPLPSFSLSLSHTHTHSNTDTHTITHTQTNTHTHIDTHTHKNFLSFTHIFHLHTLFLLFWQPKPLFVLLAVLFLSILRRWMITLRHFFLFEIFEFLEVKKLEFS